MPTDPDVDALLREADAIQPSAGDTGEPDEPFREALDMLMDIVGDNPQPPSRWGPRDWLRVLMVLGNERARADRNAVVAKEVASDLRAERERAERGTEEYARYRAFVLQMVQGATERCSCDVYWRGLLSALELASFRDLTDFEKALAVEVDAARRAGEKGTE